MKIRSLLIIFATLLPLCISCSSEEDIDQFSGNYKGNVVMNADYFKNLVVLNREVSVVPENKNLRVTLNDVSFGAMRGDFTANMKIESVSDKIFRLSSAGGVATLTMGGDVGTTDYSCNVMGSLTTIGNTNNLNLIFSMPDVMGGMKVEFSQGDVPVVAALEKSYSGEAVAIAGDFQQEIVSPTEILEIVEEDRDNAGHHTFAVQMKSERFGNFTAKTGNVAQDNNIYTFTGSGECELNMPEAPVGTYKLALAGTVNLNEPEKTEIAFTIEDVLNTLTVKFYNIP